MISKLLLFVIEIYSVLSATQCSMLFSLKLFQSKNDLFIYWKMKENGMHWNVLISFYSFIILGWDDKSFEFFKWISDCVCMQKYAKNEYEKIIKKKTNYNFVMFLFCFIAFYIHFHD